jgi:class 3 adenylate cyclase/streptogramin lyase
MAPGEREHALLAVLFTDIVGSTELAARMGDESWRRILRRHHEIMRGVVGDNGGRIVDTAGDGVFAVFPRPAAAIRCAFEGIDALRAIGVEIRAGIHFGETESSEGRVSGIVVHTAARVMALAGSGEILITRTVGDLVAGKRIAVGDRGSHELKGIPSRWDVFVVEEVEGRRPLPPIEAEVAQALRERSSGPPEPRRRLPVVIAIIAALILAIVGIARVAGDGGAPDGPVAASTTLVRIDQGTHQRMEAVVGDGISGVALGEGSVWLASVRDRSVYDVDPETLRPRNHISMPEQPLEIAVGAGSVWVTSPTTLYRIDPITRRIVDRIALGGCGPSGFCTTDVAADDGTVVATHYDDERLIHLDPAREGSDRRHLVSRPVAVAVGHGAVWILHDDQANVFLIERIDIGAGTSTEQRLPLEAYGPLQCLEHDVGLAFPAELCAAITVGRRSVWVATPGDEVSWLWHLDPDDGHPMDVGVEIDCCATAMVGTADLLGTIWIGRSSGDIMQVPEVGGVPSDDVIAIGAPVTDVAIGYGGIWVSVDGPPA